MLNLKNEKVREEAEGKETSVASYEPPQVESVLTAEEIEREAHYAGGVTIIPPPS